jgi:hypothetical protein
MVLAVLSDFPDGMSLPALVAAMQPAPHPRTLQRWLKKLHQQRKIYIRGQSTATRYSLRGAAAVNPPGTGPATAAPAGTASPMGNTTSADRRQASGLAGGGGPPTTLKPIPVPTLANGRPVKPATVPAMVAKPTVPSGGVVRPGATPVLAGRQVAGLVNKGPAATPVAPATQAPVKPVSAPTAAALFPAMTGDDNTDAIALTGYIARVTLAKSRAMALINQLAASRPNPPAFANMTLWHLRRLDTSNCAEYGASQEQTMRLDALWTSTP